MRAKMLLHTYLILMALMTITASESMNVCNAKTEFERFASVINSTIQENLNRHQNVSMNKCVTDCVNRKTMITKPHFPKGEPQEWIKVEKRDVYVFSAFYEQRSNADGPSIRIIACGLQEQFHVIGDMYCHMWYNDRIYPVTRKALYQRIYPSLGVPDMVVAHFIICPLEHIGNSMVPYAVQIGIHPSLQLQKMPTLMVLNREPVSKKTGFATCISTLYGHFGNWTMIAEIFELYTLLGAEEITIYQYSVELNTRKVLQSFVEDTKMKVNVVMWDTFPPNVETSVWCQRGALNDCLYRTGMKYEYVSITDLDEVLVPRMVPTWKELLAHIAKPMVGEYLFQHAYYRRNYTEETKQEDGLISQSSFWRTDVVVPRGRIRSKAMYKSSLAISIDLHFAYRLVEGAEDYIVEPEEGMLHHYRSYPMEYFQKYPEYYTYIEDRHMEIYKASLSERVRRRKEDTLRLR